MISAFKETQLMMIIKQALIMVLCIRITASLTNLVKGLNGRGSIYSEWMYDWVKLE